MLELVLEQEQLQVCSSHHQLRVQAHKQRQSQQGEGYYQARQVVGQEYLRLALPVLTR